MSDETTIAQPDPELAQAWDRYLALRDKRNALEAEMQECLMAFRGEGKWTKPIFHCRRCGHDWKGRWIKKPPSACPRCHSIGWAKDPVMSTARRPDMAPNPRWYVRGGDQRKPTPIRKEPAPQEPVYAFGFKTGTPQNPPGLELAPPPKLSDVAKESPSLVPPRDVRFAEDKEKKE